MAVRRLFGKIGVLVTPHFRQFLRFIGLPYCYFFLVDWRRCTASHLRVFWDFMYIFFVLRYYPDNYSNCHFYKVPRSEWAYYYGSSYNPFQRSRLRREVQPREYQVLFEDKEVCQQLCVGAGLRIAKSPGVISPVGSASEQVRKFAVGVSRVTFIAKPVSGASGQGIFLVSVGRDRIEAVSAGSRTDIDEAKLSERVLLQELVQQHPAVAAIYAGSVNTVRILTLTTKSRTQMVLSTLIRFGVGRAFIDNWSAGGVAVGVNKSTGRLMDTAYDKRGNCYDRHPDSGVVFRDIYLPLWDETLAFAKSVQEKFPYHPMLGLDVVLTETGPILIELNAFPDIILQEQTSGPLLRDPAIHREFARYDLFINSRQAKLHGST